MNQRVAAVTGAAGELGTAIVRRLLTDGYAVAALDRTEEQATELKQRFDRQPVTSYAADQTDPDAVAEVCARITTELGAPTAAVANAGYAKFGGLLDMPAKTFRRHVDVNLVGTFGFCQAIAQQIVASGEAGSITVISSNLALSHSDQVVAYGVTKAALLTLVKGLAAELGAYGIRCNAVLPGVIETAMTEFMLDQPDVRSDLIGETPLGRLGRTDDITAAIAYLASDAANWVSGAALTIDGGQSLYGQPRWMHQDRSVPKHPRWEPGLGQRYTPKEN